jgi:hypothetical protein
MFVNRLQIIGFAIASSVCATVSASEGMNTNAASVAQTVNDMIRIDADRALWTEQKMLAEAQGRLGGPPILGAVPGSSFPAEPPKEEQAPKPVVVPVRMEVLGIFGLGDNLLVDVAIDNARIRFKRGQSAPLGAGADYPYQLISIKVPCVKIADASKTEHNVCLSKSGL